jgi:hypothetical protein
MSSRSSEPLRKYIRLKTREKLAAKCHNHFIKKKAQHAKLKIFWRNFKKLNLKVFLDKMVITCDGQFFTSFRMSIHTSGFPEM